MKDIEKRIDNCEGMRIWRANARIEFYYKIFVANDRDLIAWLRKLQEWHFAATLWSDGKQQDLKEFGFQVMRLFHNYLASAASLGDHTRRQMRQLYKGMEFIKEYEGKAKSTFNSPACQFVKSLRNYILHVGIPSHLQQLDFYPLPHGKIMLNKSNLLRWKKWGHESIAYLNKAPEHIDLEGVINTYTVTVETFYNWLWSRQKEINAQHLKELAIPEDQLQTLVSSELKP